MYCHSPNRSPKTQISSPPINRFRPLTPPITVTEERSGNVSSASLARARTGKNSPKNRPVPLTLSGVEGCLYLVDTEGDGALEALVFMSKFLTGFRGVGRQRD